MQNRHMFLSILSDYLHDRPTQSTADVDWRAILDIARKHQLTGIVLAQCPHMKVDDALQFALINNVARNVQIRAAQAAFLAELDAYLTENNKPHCVVKGSVVAQYYQQYDHRAMGDIDILVPTEDREFMHQHLLSLGFNNHSKNIHHEWVYAKGPIVIEVHDKLVYPEVFNKECEEVFFNDIWSRVSNNVLEANFHFVYLLYHMKKHLTSGGIGFKSFLDIGLMIKGCPSLDRALIREYLQKADMLDFAQVIFALCAYWFEDESMYFFDDKMALTEDVLESKTEAVFRNGTFGQFNDENKINVSVNNLRYSRFKWISKLRVLILQLFPSYENMIATSAYAFLEGKPYLLPVAWVYRFFINMKKENLKTFRERKINFASADEQKEREKNLKEWKIL